MRPARTLAKKGNIPVGYYKDEKKTAETFRTINGVRYAIPVSPVFNQPVLTLPGLKPPVLACPALKLPVL